MRAAKKEPAKPKNKKETPKQTNDIMMDKKKEPKAKARKRKAAEDLQHDIDSDEKPTPGENLAAKRQRLADHNVILIRAVAKDFPDLQPAVGFTAKLPAGS